ncbi:guanine nucleotide-binding protein subunit beta-like protein 1 [Thrips palmi]|uniref:Guanine nucleotide-binding protein subunit beta-like protein 1 n=1 Tax=Thrips palmi TaxID=161013 RepID=A0A6P9A7M4_THRPL|nr:guanine nucleotide-binding protein subunit beta-like protein 1 [Thrips palmi]XP_034253984.1 guanine nucleotide-binding protein subunit beta-like protein 1 [Thrips palmi]
MSQTQSPPPPEPKFVLRDGMGPVSCIAFGLDETLYAGTQDGWIHVWDLTINRRKSSFQVGKSVCLAIGDFFTKLVVQVKGEGISVWNSSPKFALEHKFDYQYMGFCKFECDKTLNYVFVPDDDGEIKIINLRNFKLENKFICPAVKLGEVMVMKYSHYCHQDVLLVGYESGDIYVWNVTQCSHVGHFKIANAPMAIDFDPDSGKGVCGTESESVFLFKIDKNFAFTVESSIMLKNPGVSAVTIRPDRKVVVLGCWDGNIRIYSWKSSKILGVLTEHLETINALCFSSKPISMWNSIILAAGSKDKSISLWTFY